MSHQTRNKFSTNRIWIAAIFVFGAAILIAGRLFLLQVLKHENYYALAQKQQNGSGDYQPERGEIYFKNKNGSLLTAATTKRGYLLYINTKILKNPEEVLNKLSSITEIDKEKFFKILGKKDDPYEVLRHRVGQEDWEKIKALNLQGIGALVERWRFYPAQNMASHILGFVSAGPDIVEGRYGAEKFYNESLNGPDATAEKSETASVFLDALNAQFTGADEEREDLVLTIEPYVQQFAEEKLKSVAAKWSAASGGIMILEPKTGKIRALAGFPDFNPNEYQKEKKFDVFLNPFVEKIFEMGSVFKPLTMATALDLGAITPETTYVDKGEIKIGVATIKNFDEKARGKRTMTQVLEESLNTGAVFAMQKAGGENLKKYFLNFGLGEKLGIDLPGELKGDLSNLDSGREIEFATASFGQGIAVTPLELAMALSSLGNGGKLMRPTITEIPEEVIRQVIKPETSETITKMLVEVVDTALAGGKAKIPGYSIAAKTGTAQIPNKNGKGYSDEFLHSFFGYFPAYQTRFLIFMFLERPKGVKYASQSLTDTFSDIVRFLINYYTITPDR